MNKIIKLKIIRFVLLLSDRELKSGARNTALKEIDLADCDFDEDTEEFTYDCRCGSIFRIKEDSLPDEGTLCLTCDSCSLTLKILPLEEEM